MSAERFDSRFAAQDARAFLCRSGRMALSATRIFEVKNYFLDFAGDHSLDVATVTEQPSPVTRNTPCNYIWLPAHSSPLFVGSPRRSSGRDARYDRRQNSERRRPPSGLASWLPTVLVNDGHDHFDVVVSGTNPGTFSSSEDLGSRRRDTQTFVFLRSSGFKAIQLPDSRNVDPQLRQCRMSHSLARTQIFGPRIEFRKSSPPPSSDLAQKLTCAGK